jgi:hypothetical protein
MKGFETAALKAGDGGFGKKRRAASVSARQF